MYMRRFFFFQAEDGIRDDLVTGVQTCALPISLEVTRARRVLAQRETPVAQRTQRLPLRTAVLECFRDAERHLVPVPRLGVPTHLLLEPAGAQQRYHHARRIAALLAFEGLHVRLEERLQV